MDAYVSSTVSVLGDFAPLSRATSSGSLLVQANVNVEAINDTSVRSGGVRRYRLLLVDDVGDATPEWIMPYAEEQIGTMTLLWREERSDRRIVVQARIDVDVEVKTPWSMLLTDLMLRARAINADALLVSSTAKSVRIACQASGWREAGYPLGSDLWLASL